MHKYNKIETLFKRDMKGTKKLIEGDFATSTIEYLKDTLWRFTEKIDGTNIGINWNGHKVAFQGRDDESELPEHLRLKLEEMFGGEDTAQIFEQMFGEKEVVLFGEGYGIGINKGGHYRQDVSFILFDVYFPANEVWAKRSIVEKIAEPFSLEVVPVIFTGTLDEAVSFVKSRPKSTIGNADMEGLVGVPMIELKDNQGKRVIVKIKVRDFLYPLNKGQKQEQA